MNVFGDYARYYDLLYQDKDYQGEADYIYSLIKQFSLNSSSVLDLGCGTAKHAVLLAQKGLRVHGVDMSTKMLNTAKQQLESASSAVSSRILLNQGDVRTYRTEQKFDACISLFHVMSYQISNHDLQAAFQTAAAHLKPGGVFIFDYWYGPSVLAQSPEVRVKHLENTLIEVQRVAEPVMFPNENRVQVNYTVWIANKSDHQLQQLQESHDMRYLFLPEIEMLSQLTGFDIQEHYGWMEQNALNVDDWAGVSILVKK